MKKIFFLLELVSLLFSGNIYGQGTVYFTSTSTAHQILYRCIPCEAGQATVALYGGPLGATDSELVMLGTATPTLANGYINGGVRTVPFVPGGGTAVFQVRSWTGGHATFEEALASGSAVVGLTQLFQNITGNPLGVPPTIPANLVGWTQPLNMMPLSLECIPEPNTMALGVLGSALLLVFKNWRGSTKGI